MLEMMTVKPSNPPSEDLSEDWAKAFRIGYLEGTTSPNGQGLTYLFARNAVHAEIYADGVLVGSLLTAGIGINEQVVIPDGTRNIEVFTKIIPGPLINPTNIYIGVRVTAYGDHSMSKVHEIAEWDGAQVRTFSFLQFNGIDTVPAHLPWHIRNLSQLFKNCKTFNANEVSLWNTSRITYMFDAFCGATTFNQPLNNWDVSNVTNFYGTFQLAEAFNQPLDKWDTGKATNAMLMFCNASTFNQDIGGWDTSSLTDMSYMFANTLLPGVFNQNLNSWDVSNVTTLANTFEGCSQFNSPLDNWNVQKVTRMNEMLKGATVFDQDISNWNLASRPTYVNYDMNTPAWRANYKPTFI